MPSVSEATNVELWRTNKLLKLGFSLYEATLLSDENVDWHEADKLISKGCEPSLAVRILV